MREITLLTRDHGLHRDRRGAHNSEKTFTRQSVVSGCFNLAGAAIFVRMHNRISFIHRFFNTTSRNTEP